MKQKIPIFSLIFGVEILAKSGMVLDFGQEVITIDHIASTVMPCTAFNDTQIFNSIAGKEYMFPCTELEYIGPCETTKRAIEIVDADLNK